MKKFLQILILLSCVLKISAQDSLLVKEAYEQIEMFVTRRAFVVSYKAFYRVDLAGERTVKEAGGTEGVFVNSVFSGGRTDNSTFTLYVNPYMVVNNGGIYTKHIYAGSERVVSKMGDPQSYGADPRRIVKAGDFLPEDKQPDYATKYKAGQVQVRDNYAKFEVEFLGKDNDDYVNGEGFCCSDNAARGFTAFGGNIGAGNDNYENIQYYYHYDHLGSVTAITDLYGNIVQRADYIPTGEVFMEERNNNLTTSYLFNAKELDEETGLYYYGARYYNPRESVWLSVDKPLIDGTYMSGVHNGGVYNSFNNNPYIYCYNNPVRLIDPDGNQVDVTNPRKASAKPAGMSEAEALSHTVVIEGKKYHKYTGNLFAEVANKINATFGGADDYFVEHKPYDPAEDRFIHELVNTSASALVGGAAGKVIGGTVGKGAVSTSSATENAVVSTETSRALVKTGAQFSKHSLERLAQRGITKHMAELAISKGQKFYDPLNKSINYVLPNGFASGKSLLVGTNPLTGEVTTVISSSKNLINKRFIPIK